MKSVYKRDPRHRHRVRLKYGHFKTASHKERRNAADPENKLLVRAARNPTNLPDSYMDIYPSRYSVTSWKDKTKNRKQWK